MLFNFSNNLKLFAPIYPLRPEAVTGKTSSSLSSYFLLLLTIFLFYQLKYLSPIELVGLTLCAAFGYDWKMFLFLNTAREADMPKASIAVFTKSSWKTRKLRLILKKKKKKTRYDYSKFGFKYIKGGTSLLLPPL